jgi:hypothetical protein
MGFNFKRPRFATGSAPVYGRDVLRAEASLDFASVAAGAAGSATVAVPGAQVGDDVVLCPTVAPTTALVFQAYVSDVDEVTVEARNLTAAAIDQAATTYRVIVFKAY